MLYLVVVQTLALLSSHLIPTHKIIASLFTIVVMLVVNLSVGGYVIHPADTPDYIKWLIYVSPQKWLTPVLTKDEYSDETIASAGGLQLCRNKQVSSSQNIQLFKYLQIFFAPKVQHQEIIIQQPCKINGTSVLADFQLLPKNHILDPSDIYRSTLIGLIVAAITLFALTVIVFLLNTGKMFKSKNKRR